MKTAQGKKQFVRRALVSAASVALGCVALSGAAHAEQFEIKKGEFSGSFSTSYLTYRDNERTVTTLATGVAKGSKLGEFQSHTVADFDTVGSDCDPYVEAPPLRLERLFIVAKSHVVMTFKKGQLYLKAEVDPEATEADGCIFVDYVVGESDFELAELPGGFELTVKYKVVGGSGEFAGAKGEVTSTTKGAALEFNESSDGDNWFGGVTGTLEGEFCTDC